MTDVYRHHTAAILAWSPPRCLTDRAERALLHPPCSSCSQVLWNKAMPFKIRDQTKSGKIFAAVQSCPGICCAYLLFWKASLFHGAFKNILSLQAACQVPLQAGYSLLPLSQVEMCISKTLFAVIDNEKDARSFRPTCEVTRWSLFPLYEAMKHLFHKRAER